MTLLEIRNQVENCARQMNDRYGAVVFDEWAVVSVAQHKAQILWYQGPRNDAFLASFVSDLGALRAELLNGRYSAGDFEFTRHATGTLFEAFIVLGRGLYLICNNTRASMNEIALNSRWLNAQVPFAELADHLRASPLADAA
ncbi:MAG TPA: hypothetical protein VEH04_19250 [Verrucomicrobiae bacterium]|nr:hypothetical protein [Verrucomicrobiae bacterium]